MACTAGVCHYSAGVLYQRSFLLCVHHLLLYFPILLERNSQKYQRNCFYLPQSQMNLKKKPKLPPKKPKHSTKNTNKKPKQQQKKHPEKFTPPEKKNKLSNFLLVCIFLLDWGMGKSVHSHLLGNFLGEVFGNFFLKSKNPQSVHVQRLFSFHCVDDACKAYRHK